VRSIVIAYEDKYCEGLHGLIKGLRRDHGLGGIILELQTVRGTGGFVNDVPLLLRRALKQTKRVPDRLVCLADADRPQNLVPNAQPAPVGDDAAALLQWVLELEMSWKDFLVREGRLPEESAARLRVICMRWSKESLLISSPDALREYAGDRRPLVEQVLEACAPPPRTLADEEFIVRYRRPDQCMDRVIQPIHGHRYKKGLHDEDLLREQISPHAVRRAEVLRRCPDLGRLLSELVDQEDS
jgi:hypothetical protein